MAQLRNGLRALALDDRETAEDLASGRRPALDAFIAGDLVLGGDVRALLCESPSFSLVSPSTL